MEHKQNILNILHGKFIEKNYFTPLNQMFVPYHHPTKLNFPFPTPTPYDQLVRPHPIPTKSNSLSSLPGNPQVQTGRPHPLVPRKIKSSTITPSLQDQTIYPLNRRSLY